MPTPDPVEEPVGGLSPTEVAFKEEIVQRRESLGVNEGWLNQWVNQQFYDQNPKFKGRPLTTSVDDAPLRLRWDNLAMESLDTLQLNLSMPARRGLGAYGADDRESWRKTVNRLNVSSRALDDLTDAKFSTLFPQVKRDDILDQPLGQVWYAIAQDSVEDLSNGKVLEPVEFAPGSFRQRLTGQLDVGEGQVFTLNLQAGQNLRISLQAPESSTLMSLYLPVPSQKEPFLLSDSKETLWSGSLTQSGYYEIAIVSKSPDPINYALSVSVDNIRNTAPTEEEPATPDETSGEDSGETPTETDETPAETETPTENGGEDTSGTDNQSDTPEGPVDAVEFP